MLRVIFSSHAEQALAALPREAQGRVVSALERLATNPFWFSHVKKLGGSEDRYRLRADRWRVLFILKGQELGVADIFLKKGRGDYRKRLR